MKFLVDNQLPGILARHIRLLGHDCEHVLEVGLAESPDSVIRDYATSNDCILISKDEDFVFLAARPDSALKLIWVRIGNCRTPALLAAFDRFWPDIKASFASGDRIIEIR